MTTNAQKKQKVSDEEYKLNELAAVERVRAIALDVIGSAPPMVVLKLFDSFPTDDDTALLDEDDVKAYIDDLKQARALATDIFKEETPSAELVAEMFERFFV